MRRAEEDQRWSSKAPPLAARAVERAQGAPLSAHHYPPPPPPPSHQQHHHHHQQQQQQLQHQQQQQQQQHNHYHHHPPPPPPPLGSWSSVAPAPSQIGSDAKPALGPSRFQLASSHVWNRPPPRKPPEPLRRAVASCLSGSHHSSSEAVRTLQDYLSNPTTADLAYMVLLEHASAERDRSPPVISKCVTFLKRYLVRYVPKQAMLQQIDTFCATLIAECNTLTKAPLASPFLHLANDPANSRQAGSPSLTSSPLGLTKAAFSSGTLVKSLTYVRSLVARHVPSSLLQSPRIVDASHAHSKRTRSFHAPYGQGAKQEFSEAKGPGGEPMLHLGRENNDDCTHFIATDVLKWRWMGGKRQQCWTPSPVMTDSGGIARPRVKQLYEFANMGAGALFFKSVDVNVHGQGGKMGEKKPIVDKVGDQLLQPSSVTTVMDIVSSKSHLKAITASKRQKSHSQLWDLDAPRSTWRRCPRPLFQYKCYSEQQPLRLSNAEIEEVISAFCVDGSIIGSSPSGVHPTLPGAQPGRATIETADVAGSVLIKLILDMYINEPRTASPLTLSVLEGMLSSLKAGVRIRAFDLILNLGIHAHLLEPMLMEDQSTLEESSVATHLGVTTPFSSSRRGLNLEEVFQEEGKSDLLRHQEERTASKDPTVKVDSGTPKAVTVFEVWLLQILYEMLLFLVQMGEREEEVWVAALSCLLYFVCDQGRVQRQRLSGIDIRVLKAFLNVSWESAWADELHNTLVCMISNLLYKASAPEEGSNSSLGKKFTFDVEKLDLLGGIEFICNECARAKSIEAKNNIFSLLADFVLHELTVKHNESGNPCPGVDEMQAVTCALFLAGAPEALSLAFKHGLRNVGEGLSRSIMAAMSRDVDNGRLNSALLEEMTALIDGVLASYIQPDGEFVEQITATLDSEGFSSLQTKSPPKEGASDTASLLLRSWETLHTLLHSSIKTCRFHGYSWLVDLLSLQMASSFDSKDCISLQEEFWLSKHDQNRATWLFYGLLRSRHAYIRRGFILVLERLLVKCQQMAMDDLSEYMSGRNATQDGDRKARMERWAVIILSLMNSVMRQIISENDTDRINILQMCNVMFSQLCVILQLSSGMENPTNTFLRENMVFNRFGSKDVSSGRPFSYILEVERKDSMRIADDAQPLNSSGMAWKRATRLRSMAAMLLSGQAAAPKLLVSSMATDLLYWPLLQLAGAATEDIALGVAVGSQGRGCMPGGASDVRAALLVLLIGKCSLQHSAFEELGGEEFFRSLLDGMDARVAYYTASFLLKRMMTEDPEKYQQVLHSLVFRAQQSNNEKLLENPYLQMLGILQLSNDLGSQLSFQEH